MTIMYGSIPVTKDDEHADDPIVPRSKKPLLAVTKSSSRRRPPMSRKEPSRNAVLPTILQARDSSSSSCSKETPSERTLHSFVFTMLNPRSRRFSAQLYKMFITAVIAGDLGFFIASTEPELKDLPIFHTMEGITSTIFLVEYVARLVTCIESKYLKDHGPFFGRLQYLTSYNAIVDALATLPFFIEYITGLELPTLTYLRVFRLLRILKTQAFSNATDAVVRVMYYNRAILWVALFLCLGLVLTTAVLMYYLRPPPGETSADDFRSIGATMFIATLMLTGQGGPDTGALPWYTRGVVLLTGVFSIGMFAIPASMLTWGFEAEAARLAAAARRKQSGHNRESSSSSEWTSSDEDDSSDEEYQKIIAGEDDNREGDLVKQLQEAFRKADVDHSGTLTQEEFIAQMKQAKAVGRPSFAHQNGMLLHESSRMDRLEQKVDDMHDKLDQMIELLKGKE
jgi:voltage-gated potassium channel